MKLRPKFEVPRPHGGPGKAFQADSTEGRAGSKTGPGTCERLEGSSSCGLLSSQGEEASQRGLLGHCEEFRFYPLLTVNRSLQGV